MRLRMQNDLEEYLEEDCFIPEFPIDFFDDEYREFAELLGRATKEQHLQAFLQGHPRILVSHLTGHLGRWVVPQQRLGSQHVVDFMLAESSSLGFRWVAVELESPRVRMFTKRGDPTAALTHAIRQIQDWRSWLAQNLSYARRKTVRGGLGLFGVRSRLPGLIIIGRRCDLREQDDELRNQMCDDLGILIHTYDWLVPYL
jgi:hypothetical protein